jgi:hypothetical protein
MSDYTCYGDDKEDLSEEVRRKVRGLGGDMVVAVRGPGGRQQKDRPWEIVVACSQGHKNKFSGRGRL